MNVYLDNSSTTQPFDSVIEVMANAMKYSYGNPSALHRMGVDVENEIKACKKKITMTLGNQEGEIYFTSGGTEANNMAILGVVRRGIKRKNHVITSRTEHKSVLEACEALSKEGATISYLEPDRNGYIGVEQVLEAITEKTALITMMYVNNETGIIQPVEALAKALKKMKNPPLLHVDAVQAYGKVKIDLRKTPIDLLTASGHKIHGPKGIGFLWVKKNTPLEPLIFGGGQQNNIRPGTENTYGIVGLGKAVEETFENFDEKNQGMRQLRDRLREDLLLKLPQLKINTPIEFDTAPHILHVSFPKIRGEVLLHALEREGIFVSIGSACNSKVKKYSHVLEAMKLSVDQKEGAVRFSLSTQTNEAQITYATKVICEQYQSLYEIIKGR